MAMYRFASEAISGGRKGIIKPDAAGYYEMCIGGFNIKNAGGAIYTAEYGRKIFAQNSDFMRRLKNKSLKGEAGHPRRTPGMSQQDWFNRTLDIDEGRVCVYWSHFDLDDNYGRNNPEVGEPNMVGVMARFRPGGVMGDFLARDMADGETNVCFSFRALSEPYMERGQKCFAMQILSTVDYVIEPGLHPANKMASPTMESRTMSMVSNEVTNFSPSVIEEAARAIEEARNRGVTMESGNMVMALRNAQRMNHNSVSAPTHFLAGWK